MTASARQIRFTRDEYVAYERVSNTKHEFFEGEIFGMAGGTPEHAAIAINVATLLSNALRGRPCRVYSSDLRVRSLDSGLETYPDVTVVCGKPDRRPETDLAVVNPIVVVEVQSPSTAAYDRGEKLEHYKTIATLREVVLVDDREQLVVVHRRAEDGRWTRHEAGAGAAAKLVSLDCELPVDEVYRDDVAG